MPASDTATSSLSGMGALGLQNTGAIAFADLEKGSRPSSRVYDEVDALDFLVAVERYKKKFRDLHKSERLRSPDPLTYKTAIHAHVRRKPRPSQKMNEALQAELNLEDLAAAQEILSSTTPADIGLNPATQPLWAEMDKIVRRYLGGSAIIPIAPARPKWSRAKYHSGSSSATASNENSDEQLKFKSRKIGTPLLKWMVGIGLVSDRALSLACAEAEFSTHPDTLDSLAEAVSAYLSSHVLPFFFLSVAKNLSVSTLRGRLAVGIVCFVIAITFSVLLIIEPSPLTNTNISRWWRLLIAPFWCVAIGYALAYRTGVCVWLTLRGNREPDEQEEREREQIRSRLSDAAGFSFADVEAEAEMKDERVETRNKKWMAPELASIVGRKAKIPKAKEMEQVQPSSSSAALIIANAVLASPIKAGSASLILDGSENAGSKPHRVPLLPLVFGVVKAPNRPFLDATEIVTSPPVVTRDALLFDPELAQPTTSTPRRRSVWKVIQQWTGFAAGTEKVLDCRVRRAQQIAALKAMTNCFAATLVVMVIVVAVP